MTAVWGAVVVCWVLAYEVGRRRGAGTGETLPQWRRACWWGAGLLLALAGLPPLADAAHAAVWAQAFQFGLLAFGVTPLAVLAAPGHVLGAHGKDVVRQPMVMTAGQGWAALVLFLAATIGWRLPAAVDAVAGGGPWLLVEAATVVVGTSWLWVALVGSPPAAPMDAPPRRIVLTALAVWVTWTFAYVVGFASHPFYPAYSTGVTPVGSQQWVVGVLWGMSAVALLPVAFSSLARWFSSEQARAVADERSFLRRPLPGSHVGPGPDGRPAARS